MKQILQNCINHIVFVVDASGSMSHLTKTVINVFDKQIEILARRSKELDQETRVTVYMFDSTVRCLVYDKDVLRMPSLAQHYRASGGTALLDATGVALDELAQTAQLHGDHAFLTYVLTDGEENSSRKFGASSLKTKIERLPDNWTIAAFVPDQHGAFECKKAGFPAQNIAVWDATSVKGLEKAGGAMQSATENFMVARSTGVRGTKNLFQLNTSVTANDIKAKLTELSPTDYSLFPVSRDAVIKDFVESWTQKPYRAGAAYYQLTKKETIQGYKQICIQQKSNGKVYSGPAARQLLGLPSSEVKVAPADYKDFDIFIQSTAQNRKLIGGSKLIVLN